MNERLFYQFAALIVVFIIIFLVIAILFLVSLHKTLQSIKSTNREMEPGEVFLLLIPLFNYVWIFFVVIRLSNSIKKEMISRNMQIENRPAYGSGISLAILSVISLVSNYLLFDYFLFLISSIGAFVAFFVYWFVVANYRTKIETDRLKVLASE